MSWLSKLLKPMPFADAVRARKVSEVRKHLEGGVDPNQKVDGDRVYPLHFAVHAGAEIVGILVQYGAKVNVKSDGGKTALHLAAVNGDINVVTLLIQAGAEVNAVDSYGHTPMFDAAAHVSVSDMIFAPKGFVPSKGALRERSGREAVVALLKSRGASPSQADAETAKAIGSVPEAERHTRHMTLAHNQGDGEYHQAVRKIIREYPFLHDAHQLLRDKADLATTEKTFVDRFEYYERMVR